MMSRHLYVHVPFCARRCSYCDFSIAVRRATPIDEFILSLERELSIRAAAGELDTLYLGGGTPSRLGGDGVARALEAVLVRHSLARDAEVTIEANPEDVTLENAQRWRAAGVNRLSIGIQSLDDAVLAWMHRVHDAAGARQAVELARSAGISNLSLDLIFALPAALGRDWPRDLDAAIELGPDHISLYGLTVEPKTPLGRWSARGEVAEAPEEWYERDFIVAHERLTAAGYEHYEVSSYARRGYRSRHNSSYWSAVPYAGYGPSAHSFDGSRRRWNVAPYVSWVALLAEGRDPIGGDEVLSAENRSAERVYLGLRTSDGLPVTPDEAARARPWVEAGWAELDLGTLRLTPAGWLRMDSLAADLTIVGSRY